MDFRGNMKFRTKYLINLHRAYFEKGLQLTNYVKYFIAFFGLASRDVSTTLIIGLIYAIMCYFIGFLWLKYGFFEAEQEVSNKNNLFVKELRNRKI